MEMLKINSDKFEEEVLKSKTPVLVDFNADWCGPCKMLGPIIEEEAKENDKVKFVSVNKMIMSIIHEALSKTEGFPENVLTQIFTRDDVAEMLKQDKYIDLIIPRGGNKLVKFIKENTKIPVLGHADGVCHIYVDKFADMEKAKKIIISCID